MNKLFVICLIFISYAGGNIWHQIEGSIVGLSLSGEEDLELEGQLKVLNKPPLLSSEGKDGDFIDCIDIYKQPAFDHPLLKNHTLQMRPSALPEGSKFKGDQDSRKPNDQFQRKFWNCPPGAVPFRRTRKEDLIRAKAALNFIRQTPINPTITPSSDIHYAVVSAKDPSQNFYGAKTSISVYNLSRIEAPQISQALLWIGTAVDGPYNSLEYGWTVNPTLYGDSQPRTYSYWTADGTKSTGCYNALCPGYVQVSQKRIMGEVNHPVTVFGKDVYAMQFSLFKDPKTSNWWLFENLGDKPNEPVGYWPKELFPAMADSAKVAQLGGKVYEPPNTPINPPMGSGAFISDDFTRTCYASNIEFVNSSFQFYLPKDVDMEVIQDKPNTYEADYLGDASKEHPQRGYTLLFGGPDIRD
ncbi:hypothetical protein Cgig2_010555 [Carnegiea gigantea]|uniref:Neprosin PEP catalytic domain-containing protein n=1 Tax=Carnegiea gigantea TaxID=171969 RepID=A0A9Q1KTL7_9CARY|nr:hypothetical protein Cgig2_010555 [Carnegiea gigantea]